MTVTITDGISNVVGTASQLSGALTAPVTATQVTSITSTQVTGAVVASQVTSITATQVTGTVTASQGGTGLTSVGLNLFAVGTAAGAYALSGAGDRLIAYSTDLVMTATGDDVLTMSNAVNLGQYIIRRITWGFPVTAALATVVVVATMRTASGGAGSAITGSLIVTGLSATTAFLDQAVTLASAAVTSSQLYVNVTTAAATAPSSSIFVWGQTVGV